MTDTDDARPATVEREWTFRCRTFDKASGKLLGEWTDHNGTERSYSDIPRGARPGSVWRIHCTEDGTRASIKFAEYTGTVLVDHDDLPDWKLRDRAAQVAKQRQAELRKLGDVAEVDAMTIAEVRRALAGRGSYTHRSAFIAVVLERLGLGWSA